MTQIKYMYQNKLNDLIKIDSSSESQNSLHEPSTQSSSGIINTWKASKDYEKYKKIIEEKFLDHQTQTKNLLAQVVNDHIGIQTTAIFVKQIQVNILLLDIQTMLVELMWGYFKVNVSVFIINLQFEQIHVQDAVQRGNFGQVYTLSIEDEQFIIKPKKLKTIISQIRILRILYKQNYNISPRVHNIFGFDIILYRSGAVFVQDLCCPILQLIQNNKDIHLSRIQNQLKENLKTLHLLNICHFDIKPYNIVWSERLSKTLIIDFGLSKYVQQKVGYLSSTGFKGTYNYCSHDMRKLYFLKNNSKIDVYYNDAIGLQATMLKLIQKKKKQFCQNVEDIIQQLLLNREQQEKTQKINSFYLIKKFLKIRYSYFTKNFEEFFNLMLQQQYFVQSTYKFLISEVYKSRENEVNQKKLRQCKQLLKNKIDNQKYLKQLSYLDKIYLNAHQNYNFQLSFDTQDIINNASISKQLLQSQQFISSIIDYFYHSLSQLNSVSNSLKISRLINKLYLEFKKNYVISISNQNDLFKLVILLSRFQEFYTDLQNKEFLLKLRKIFIKIQNYNKSSKIEDIIVDLPQIRQSYQFYFFRIQFQLQRLFWLNNIFFCGLSKWISKNKYYHSDQVRDQLEIITKLIVLPKDSQQIKNLKKAHRLMSTLLQNSKYETKLGINGVKRMHQLMNLMQTIVDQYERNKLMYKNCKNNQIISQVNQQKPESQDDFQSQQEYFMTIKNMCLLQYHKQNKFIFLSGKRLHQKLSEYKSDEEVINLLNQIKRLYDGDTELYFLHIEHILVIQNLKKHNYSNQFLKVYVNLISQFRQLNGSSTIRLKITKILFNKYSCKYLCYKQKDIKQNFKFQQHLFSQKKQRFFKILCQLKNQIKEIQLIQKDKRKVDKIVTIISQTLQIYFKNGLQKCLEYFFSSINSQNIQNFLIGESFSSVKGFINFMVNIYSIANFQIQQKYQSLYKAMFQLYNSMQCSQIVGQILLLEPLIRKCLNVQPQISKNFDLIIKILSQKRFNQTIQTTRRHAIIFQRKIYLLTKILVQKCQINNLINIRQKIILKIKYQKISSHYFLSIFVFVVFATLEVQLGRRNLIQQCGKKLKMIILSLIGIDYLDNYRIIQIIIGNIYGLYEKLFKIKSQRKLLRLRRQKCKSYIISQLAMIRNIEQQLLQLINKKFKKSRLKSQSMFIMITKKFMQISKVVKYKPKN